LRLKNHERVKYLGCSVNLEKMGNVEFESLFCIMPEKLRENCGRFETVKRTGYYQQAKRYWWQQPRNHQALQHQTQAGQPSAPRGERFSRERMRQLLMQPQGATLRGQRRCRAQMHPARSSFAK
jgi:hypothetical protein